MARRAAKVTEEELKRALRAVQSAGLSIETVTASPEGYVVQVRKATHEKATEVHEPPVIL